MDHIHKILFIFLLSFSLHPEGCENYQSPDPVDYLYAMYSAGGVVDTASGSMMIPGFFSSFLKQMEFDRSYRLVYSLLITIMISISTMIFILPFILLNRNKIEKRQEINQFLKEKYQEALIEYLYNEQTKDIKEKIRQIAQNDYNRQFLINEIIDLSINLKGQTADQLRKLYLDLGLDRITYQKLRSKKWHYKIKAFRELSFMNLTNTNDEIIKSLDSKNEIVRMEAQIALTRLDDRDPFKFLDYIDRPFTLWEQMNIYELMVLHNLAVPDFSQWIHSSNKTVAIFAVNMIRVFKQSHLYPHLIVLLDHEDTDIRKAVITALGSFKIPEVLDPLKKHFSTEIYENKMTVLLSLQKSTDESNIPFLKWVLENESDVFIQIEAAKGIRNIGETGENELENLIKSDEYRNYQIILRHVLDKRI